MKNSRIHLVFDILMVLMLCLVFIGCTPPGNEVKPEQNDDVNQDQSIENGFDGDLVITRLYIGVKPYGNNKFFAITNVSAKDVDLSDYRIIFKPSLKDGAVYNLPKTTLAPGKTLWCLNGWHMAQGWGEKFPSLYNLPVLKENGPYDAITEDTIWYGIKGYYTTNVLSIGKVVGDKIDIIDTAPAFKKPCAYLRSFDNASNKDNGWFTLKWDSAQHREALESGSISGEPDIKPIAPAPDMDAPEAGEQPGIDKGDKVAKVGSTKLADNIHLGYPEVDIKKDPKNEKHFLIERDCYVLSYNRELHNPNWVSWHLQDEDMGSGREDAFHHEYRLPVEWNETLGSDYSGSGFSRGHMCSNAERNGNGTVYDTFSMANMLPQTQGNNGGPWGRIEDYLRTECGKNKEAYIVAGGYGSGGIGRNGDDIVYSIRDSNGIIINVPEIVWKVVILMDRNDTGADKARIEADYKDSKKVEAFAVWMPNDETQCKENHKDWKKYAVSIDYVEQMTGLDFFAELDDVVEDYLEAMNKYAPAKNLSIYEFSEYKEAV